MKRVHEKVFSLSAVVSKEPTFMIIALDHPTVAQHLSAMLTASEGTGPSAALHSLATKLCPFAPGTVRYCVSSPSSLLTEDGEVEFFTWGIVTALSEVPKCSSARWNAQLQILPRSSSSHHFAAPSLHNSGVIEVSLESTALLAYPFGVTTGSVIGFDASTHTPICHVVHLSSSFACLSHVLLGPPGHVLAPVRRSDTASFVSMVTSFAPAIAGQYLIRALMVLLHIQHGPPGDALATLLITGPPQCGKSALLDAFARVAPLAGIQRSFFVSQHGAQNPYPRHIIPYQNVLTSTPPRRRVRDGLVTGLDICGVAGGTCIVDDVPALPASQVSGLCDVLHGILPSSHVQRPGGILLAAMTSAAEAFSGASTATTSRLVAVEAEVSAAVMLSWRMVPVLRDDCNQIICASTSGHGRAESTAWHHLASGTSCTTPATAVASRTLEERLHQAAMTAHEEGPSVLLAPEQLREALLNAASRPFPQIGASYFGLPFEEAILAAVEGFTLWLPPAKPVACLISLLRRLVFARACADAACMITEDHISDAAEILGAALESTYSVADASCRDKKAATTSGTVASGKVPLFEPVTSARDEDRPATPIPLSSSPWSQLLGGTLLDTPLQAPKRSTRGSSKRGFAMQVLGSLRDLSAVHSAPGATKVDLERAVRRLPGYAAGGRAESFEEALSLLSHNGLIIQDGQGRLRAT